jgi:hypothetical protein
MTCKETNERVLSISNTRKRKNGEVWRSYICRTCRRERYHRNRPDATYNCGYKPTERIVRIRIKPVKPDIPVETYYENPNKGDYKKFGEILKNADTINQNIMRKYAIPAGSRYRHMV